MTIRDNAQHYFHGHWREQNNYHKKSNKVLFLSTNKLTWAREIEEQQIVNRKKYIIGNGVTVNGVGQRDGFESLRVI